MKHKIGILLVTVLTITLLFACKEAAPADKTRKPIHGTETVTLSSQGIPYKQQFSLDFSQESPLYTLSPLTNTSFHSCVSCKECGYTQIGEDKAYKVHNTTHSGFQVHLTTPMKADSLQAMKITYFADTQATESEVRIYCSDDNSLSTIINSTTGLGGANNKWRTTSVGLKGLTALAEDDGYVHSFQLVMRNKNNATFHIRELTLFVNPEALCNVNLETATQGEKATVTAIAKKIQESFTQINCQATITVSCNTYLQNSTKYDGEITYTAKVELGKKTIEYKADTKIIPKVSNQWLSNEGSPYGATQDRDTNWAQDFAPSGILTLSKRRITCDEGLSRMEYAVAIKGTTPEDSAIHWYAVQQHKWSKNGIQDLYINAFLDYGDALTAGEDYTLYVRAVTNSNNYILHIKKDFTYQPYSHKIALELSAALKSLSGKTFWFSHGNTAKDVLADVIDNENIVIHLEEQKGYSSSTCLVGLSYADSKFKDYTGEAFKLNNVVIWNSQALAQATILPALPGDGAKDIKLASAPILQYVNASYKDIIHHAFESFNKGEVCTPPAVHFTWNGPDGTYCLKISEDESMKNARMYETTKKELDVYNLETGTTYYWQVTLDGKTSPVFTFTTQDTPRYLKIDGVSNMRDLGGYITTDGQRVKQGLIYRSGNFDSIGTQGKTELIKILGLKTDLDFRGDDAKAPLGNAVQHIQIPIKWYDGIFPETEAKLVGDVFKVFAKEENYPIGYHCAIGRDRTGTVSVLLLGLLGVEEETIMKEYLMSFHSVAGGYTPSMHIHLYNTMLNFMNGLSAYAEEGASFQKQVEGFLLEAGVTHAELNAIRNILLEK